jgi:brefeldin A-inhibited guanine nucleotide-exchange protein
MGMHVFQFDHWPSEVSLSAAEEQEDPDPVAEPETECPTAADSSIGGISLEIHLNNNRSAASSETETESVVGDFSQAPQDDDLRPFDDVSVTTATTAASTIAEDTSIGTGTGTGVGDPFTREPMHESIVHALEAYVMVMMHPQKTNKACEQALECVTQLVLRKYVSGRAGGLDDGSGSGAAQRELGITANANTANAIPSSLMHQIMVGIQKCSESNTESVQSHVITCFKEILISTKCGVHEASMLLAIRSIFHIYLVTKSPTIQQSAKTALMEMVASTIQRIVVLEDSPPSSPPYAYKTNPLFLTDSYYLMRSLVKLSSKTLPGIDDNTTTPTNFLAQQFLTTTTVDPLALNNKVLSLELILQVMDLAGEDLCYEEKFIHLVQSQLCVALLKNCMSNHTQVAFLSQKIFLILVYKFKTHLKDEIQVFMSNIFLRVLESENSSYAQKALVLESLRSVCNDPVLLTQIFLNYDCDFDAMNLYKDIVFHLTKLSGKSTTAQPLTNNMSKKDAEEHSELSLAGVEVLVTILQAFLNALGMPSTNEEANDTAGKSIRRTLKLENVGGTPSRPRLTARVSTMESEGDLTVQDLEQMQQQQQQQAQASSSLLHVESSSDVAGKIVDAFDRKRNAEQNFEMGGVKFTLSYKQGLNFFIDNGFVTLEAKEVALFFLANKEKLDKTQIGEVLGREPEAAFVKTTGTDPEQGGPGFFIRVLHHYVDAMDFSDLMFADAIRLFLSGFRLPGEAQKIDRIMEKFAERYTRFNSEVFPSADTAFILAFSVIMLNTDLHNPSIKEERRMTPDSFVRNNRGIGENGGDLPEEFLHEIFSRIKASPFSLKEDDHVREKAAAEAMQDSYFRGEGGGLLGFGLVGAPTTEDRKREKFKKERDEMMTATEQLIRQRKGKSACTTKSIIDGVAPADVVKPMFDVTWGPIIGLLSQVLECSNDERSIAVCLNGFVYAIRIASHSDMSLARDTFVNSLAKFTFLGSIKEMTFKNIEAIRTLMSIAITDGEFLGESWGPVLQCISQLARMRMAASGLDSDESFLNDASQVTPSKQPVTKSYFSSQSKADISKETEELNARAILESFSDQLIDQVFSSTVKLSAHSLADFIRQLVAVSASEVEGESRRGITGVKSSTTGSSHGGEDGPSIFSLQRLVEVADYNMDVRPRLVWTQVWEIMAEFFTKFGCHRNAMVSVFAIDSLKQLSSKFLEKPELSEFNFQRIFLQPFLLIMENPNTRQDIRELILECINQMINTKAHNLQSGWKIFFDILMVSANDSSERITLLALSILQRMLDEHLDQLTRLAKVNTEIEEEEFSAVEKRNRNSNAEDFIGMCRASLSFIQLKDSHSPRPLGVSMRALCHTAIYADLIVEGRILPPVFGAQSTDPDAPGYTYEGLSEPEALEMALWRTMLEGLADGAKCNSRSRAGGVGCLVQRGSVLAIRAILLRHGSLFSTKQLSAILKDTIVPAIQEAGESDQSPVIFITSESPAVSSLDFLVEPMPIPPPRYDRGLLKFEEVARSVEW